MAKIKSYLIPFILFILSLALRASLISKGPYHVDCLDLAIQSEATLKTFRLHYLFGSGYPMTVILGAFFVSLFKFLGIHDPVIAVNAMSVVFGALCILALYLVSQKLLNERVAFFSAIMFSVMPSFLGVSVYGKNHAPGLFFLLMGIYLLLCYHENKKIFFLFLSSLSIGLLGAIRLQDMLLMIPALSFLHFQDPSAKTTSPSIDQNKQPWKNIFIFWFMAFIIVVGLHLPFLLKKGESYYQTQLFQFGYIGLIKNYLGINWKMLLWSLYLTETNFTFAGLLLAIFALWLLLSRFPKIFFFLLLWFIIPFFFYANLRTTVERFLIITYLPLVISQGYLFEQLLSLSKRIKYLTLVLFIAITLLLLRDIYPILHFRHRHDLITAYAKWVQTKTEPNAVIVTGEEGVLIQHYARRKTIPHLFSIYDPITKVQLIQYKKQLDDYLHQGVPLYITATGLYADNPDRVFPRFLIKHYQIIFVGSQPFQYWHRGETFHEVNDVDLFRIL